MYLVDEEDNVALLLDLVNEALYAALELSAELSSRDESGEVEQVELLIREIQRNIALVYPLGDTLGDSGLADAGLADEAGVVLGAAREYLYHARYFLVSADYAVELTVSGFLREVGAVAPEELELLLLFLFLGLVAPEESLPAGLILAVGVGSGDVVLAVL